MVGCIRLFGGQFIKEKSVQAMYSWLSVLWVAVVVVTARPRDTNEISKRQANGTCGNLDFRSTSGFISTPNYPNNYGFNMDCEYTIQPANLSSFWVNFHACDCVLESSAFCDWDWISFDATNNNGTLHSGTKFCGFLSGRSFAAPSFSGKVEVSFHSDHFENARGCNIGYSVDGAPPTCPNISTPQPSNYTTPSWNYTTPSWSYTTPSWNYTSTDPPYITTAAPSTNGTCGNLDFRSTSGFISTPNYPNNYGFNMDCEYTIQPANLSSFWVNFHACDCVLESSAFCVWDWISFNATNNNGTLHSGTKFCGFLSGRSFAAPSFNGKVEVSFHSDHLENARGCNIGYSVDGAPPTCPNISTPQPSNYTTPSWNYTTPSWSYTTPSWNYTSTDPPCITTAAPSNFSIYDLLDIMFSKQYALENAYDQYRLAVSDVINRLMN